MHEMSIALAVVGQVEDALRAGGTGAGRGAGGAGGTERVGRTHTAAGAVVLGRAQTPGGTGTTLDRRALGAADRTGRTDRPGATGTADSALRADSAGRTDPPDAADPAVAGRRVGTVALRVGELAGVAPDALRFCFELACEGTLLAGAELVTEPVPGRAACDACTGEWATGMPPQLCCPGCGAAAARLVSGRELEIAGVRWADGPLATAREEA